MAEVGVVVEVEWAGEGGAVYNFGLPLSVGEAECAVVRAACLFGAVQCWSASCFPSYLSVGVGEKCSGLVRSIGGVAECR